MSTRKLARKGRVRRSNIAEAARGLIAAGP
jgi:hypothetical protein